MNYLKGYKLFESTEEITENIELCKDLIETFNEMEDNFMISNFQNGFYSDRWHEDHKSENDKLSLYFNFGLKKDIDKRWFKDFENPINVIEIDDVISILTKSKQLLSRLSSYCDTIHYKIENKHVNIVLIFENVDENSKNKTIEKRIYQSINDYLKDYENSKTITILQMTHIEEDRIREKYKKLFELIKLNPTISHLALDKEIGNQNLSIRYAASETIRDHIISIKIGPFKYKTWRMDKYKAIKLSNEEIKELIEIVKDKLIGNYYIKRDANHIEISSKENIINMKIK